MTIVESRPVTGGVDTHLDSHTAAVVDANGGVLEVAQFPATAAGYRQLHTWMNGFGPLERVGIEGTGAYGAGLTRHLHRHGVDVIEVDRPNRQARRQHGKSDPLDAIEAARAALSGRASGAPKTGNGHVEAIRVLAVARRSARRHGIPTAPSEARNRAVSSSAVERLTRATSTASATVNTTGSASISAIGATVRSIRHGDTSM